MRGFAEFDWGGVSGSGVAADPADKKDRLVDDVAILARVGG